MAESTLAWLPNIDDEKNISWTRSDTEVPPLTTNIMGPPGAIGPKGNTGEKGDTGATGPQGAKGDTGPQGNQGNAGAKGDKGETGEPGLDGEPGEEGPEGPKGDQGDQGEPGQGVAAGGNEGDVLVKASADDFDTTWKNFAGGGDMMAADYDPDGSIAGYGSMNTWLNQVRPFKNNIFVSDTAVFPDSAVDGDILLVTKQSPKGYSFPYNKRSDIILNSGSNAGYSAFSADGTYLVTGQNSTITVYTIDGDSFTAQSSSAISGNTIRCLSLTKDNILLVGTQAGGMSQGLMGFEYDGNSMTMLFSDAWLSDTSTYIAVNNAGNLAVCTRNNLILQVSKDGIYDVGRVPEINNSIFTAFQFTPDDQFLVAGIETGTGHALRMFSVSGTTFTEITDAITEWPTTMAYPQSINFTSDGTYMAVGNLYNQQCIRLYKKDGSNPKYNLVYSTPTFYASIANGVQWTKDDQYVVGASTSSGQRFKFFKLDQDTLVEAGVADWDLGTPSAPSFSPDGRFMCLSSGSTVSPAFQIFEGTGV